MAKLYKQIKVKTDNLGSTGAQVLIGTVTKLDPQASNNGYLNNIRLSTLLNDHPGGYEGGFMAYLTTDNTWDDSNIISARAGNFADTVNIPAKRTLRQGTDNVQGNMGDVHLWMEITDNTVSADIDMRVVVETWGNFIKFDFA